MNREGCNWNNLALDEACVFLNSNEENCNATLYSLSSDCVSCPYAKVSWILPGWMNTSLTVSTAQSVTWRIYNDSGIQEYRSATIDNNIVCQLQPNLGEYGIYELRVNDQGCEFDTILEPTNPYTRLAIILGTVLGLLLVIQFVNARVIQFRNKRRNASPDKTSDNNDNILSEKKQRILAIDTVRGMTILLMIFVIDGAGGYVFLEYTTWNGLLPGDLVFPGFLWVMGICIPMSLSSQLARGTSRLSMIRGIIKRSFLFFLIGMSLSAVGIGGDLKGIRIFGVLQRMGVAYFVVGILYTFLSRRIDDKYKTSTTFSKIADFIALLPQWIAMIVIVAVHTGITFYLPVPGCPTGYLGPGGIQDDGLYANCTGGAAGYIDKIVLGTDHLFRHSTVNAVYHSGPFDPEGILGCLTTIFQAFLGVQTGKILCIHKGWKDRVFRWLFLGLICAGAGCALHFTNTIPINKNLWSLSFVFATTAFSLAVLTMTYLLVDVTRVWRGGPFRVPGMNTLAMYIAGRMWHNTFPFSWNYGEMNSHTWRLIAAFWDIAAWTCVAYYLHRKKMYITL